MTGRALRTTISSMTCIDNPAIMSQSRHKNPTGDLRGLHCPESQRSRAGLQTHVTIPWRPSEVVGESHPRIHAGSEAGCRVTASRPGSFGLNR
jgi:hypothetical protein